MTQPRTIVEKIWDDHVVSQEPGAPAVLAVDLHLVHEVTSPQAFSGLRSRGLGVRHPERTVATADHSTPTHSRALPMADPMAASTNLIANVLQLPGAPLIAWAVALLEGVGGLMLAVGLMSRLVAPLVLVQMLVICYLLGPTYPWIDRGIEYPVVLALLAFYIACRGSGRGSLDAR